MINGYSIGWSKCLVWPSVLHQLYSMLPGWRYLLTFEYFWRKTPVDPIYLEQLASLSFSYSCNWFSCFFFFLISGVNTMKTKAVENMFVNFVARVFSPLIVWKNICLLIVISKDSPVISVENSSKMIRVIEDTWFVYMGKSTHVKFAKKIFLPWMESIYTKEKFMVLCIK